MRVTTLLVVIVLVPFKAAADQQTCMAQAMYFEARNQGILGMRAVGIVINNRVRHPSYPSTVCAVIRQGRLSDGKVQLNECQFTFYCDGKPERPTDKAAWKAAKALAAAAITNNPMIDGLEKATHYHSTSVQPQWAKRFQSCKKIGAHVFYKKE